MADALCPVCKVRPPAGPFRPFCSRRCADVDLGRWLKGGYVVEGDEKPPEGPAGGGAEDPE